MSPQQTSFSLNSVKLNNVKEAFPVINYAPATTIWMTAKKGMISEKDSKIPSLHGKKFDVPSYFKKK